MLYKAFSEKGTVDDLDIFYKYKETVRYLGVSVGLVINEPHSLIVQKAS